MTLGNSTLTVSGPWYPSPKSGHAEPAGMLRGPGPRKDGPFLRADTPSTFRKAWVRRTSLYPGPSPDPPHLQAQRGTVPPPSLPPMPSPGQRSLCKMSRRKEGHGGTEAKSPLPRRRQAARLCLPQRAMKTEKKTVAGLSKRWLARAVAHAELIFQ